MGQFQEKTFQHQQRRQALFEVPGIWGGPEVCWSFGPSTSARRYQPFRLAQQRTSHVSLSRQGNRMHA
jgi:hypothetical protein